MTYRLGSFTRRTFLSMATTAGVGVAGILKAAGSSQLAAPRYGVSDAGDLVKIDANENPYGPSESALRAIQAHFSQGGRYPANTPDLYQALCTHHHVGAGMIDVGYGSSEILKMAVETFLGSGKNVVVAHPTYEAMSRYGSVYGATTIRVPLDSQYQHDLDKMRAAVNEKTGLVYICNPNNPTATVVAGEKLQRFVESMPPDVPVLIDEAYHHYVENTAYRSAIPLVLAGKSVIVTRTFSKIYGMAGLRLGYAIAREDLISRMADYKIWLNTNVLTVAAALASLDDRDFVERNRRLNFENRKYVEQEVKRMGLDYIPSEANFLMIDLKRDMRSVGAALRAQNIHAGRPFNPLTNHLRVTIGTAAEMKRFADALREIVA